MNFLEKNLESIIYHEYWHCLERGLSIEPYQHATYRQLNLAPYGVADLVHIGKHDYEPIIRARIIECKRNVVDAATFAQAARYQVALSRILDCCCSEYEFEKVLIGQRINPKGDFWALVASDPHCRVYTYEYKADGIHFYWHRNFSGFGTADASKIHRPSVDALFGSVARILARKEEE